MHALEPTDESHPVEALGELQVRDAMRVSRAIGEMHAIVVGEAFTANRSRARLASFAGNGGVTTAGRMTPVASESSEAIFAGNSGMELAWIPAAPPLAGATCTGKLLRSCPSNQICCPGCIFEDSAFTTDTTKSAAQTERSGSE